MKSELLFMKSELLFMKCTVSEKYCNIEHCPWYVHSKQILTCHLHISIPRTLVIFCHCISILCNILLYYVLPKIDARILFHFLFRQWRRLSATLRNPIVSHLYKTGVVLTSASHCDDLHVWLSGQVARSFWDTYLLSELKFFYLTWPHLKLKRIFICNSLHMQYFIALKLFLSCGLRQK